MTFELYLEGQAGFCQWGKYREWHSRPRKGMCKGVELGRSTKEVLEEKLEEGMARVGPWEAGRVAILGLTSSIVGG